MIPAGNTEWRSLLLKPSRRNRSTSASRPLLHCFGPEGIQIGASRPLLHCFGPDGIQIAELHVPYFTVSTPRDTGIGASRPLLHCSGPGWDTRRTKYTVAGLDVWRPAVGPRLRKAKGVWCMVSFADGNLKGIFRSVVSMRNTYRG